MSTEQNASNTTAPTQFLQVSNEAYAYRRLGSGPGLPLLDCRSTKVSSNADQGLTSDVEGLVGERPCEPHW